MIKMVPLGVPLPTIWLAWIRFAREPGCAKCKSSPSLRSGRWEVLRVCSAAGGRMRGMRAREQSATRRRLHAEAAFQRPGSVRELSRSAMTWGSPRAGGECRKPPLGPKAPKPV